MPIETNPPQQNLSLATDTFADMYFMQVEEDRFILHPDIQYLLAHSHERSVSEHICAHDLPHAMRVTQNAFVLHTMLETDQLYANFTKPITKPDIALATYGHDLGYGADEDMVRVEDKEVVGHEKASWHALIRRIHTFPRGHRTRRYFLERYDLLQAGILGTEKDATTLIEDATKHPTKENIFALLISAADKADYFIRQRVQHLPTPTDMTNPYLALAHAVDTYHLQVNQNEQTLTYSIKLHTDTAYKNNPQKWQEDAEEHYRQVFQLLEAVAEIAGYTFKTHAE